MNVLEKCPYCGKKISINSNEPLGCIESTISTLLYIAHLKHCKSFTKEQQKINLPEIYLPVSRKKPFLEIEKDLLKIDHSVRISFCGDFLAPVDKDDVIWTGEPEEMEINTFFLDEKSKRKIEEYFDLPNKILENIDGLKVQ